MINEKFGGGTLDGYLTQSSANSMFVMTKSIGDGTSGAKTYTVQFPRQNGMLLLIGYGVAELIQYYVDTSKTAGGHIGTQTTLVGTALTFTENTSVSYIFQYDVTIPSYREYVLYYTRPALYKNSALYDPVITLN